MRIKEEIRIFQVICKEKNSDVKQWFFHNVLLGLSPIWLSWIPLVLGLVFNKFYEPLRDGSILIFAVTLSGASLAYFAEETRRELRETKRFLYNWIIVLILIASAGFSVIVAERVYFPGKLSAWMICASSVVILILSILLNLHLAAVRLAYADDSLIQKILGIDAKALSQKASSASNVNGVRI